MNDSAQNLDAENDDAEDGELTLIFTAEGQAVLEEDGEPVWMSDDDDDFQVEFGNEFLDPDQDSREILNWLEEEGWIDTEEKEDVTIEIEYEDGTDSESGSVTD